MMTNVCKDRSPSLVHRRGTARTPAVWFVFACATAIGASFQLGSRDGGAEVVRARRFVLIDDAGKTIGEWGPDPKDARATSLVIYDTSGTVPQPAVVARVQEGQSELWVRGGAGNGAVRLQSSQQAGELSLYTACTDPSHTGIRLLDLARILADGNGASIELLRHESVKVNGEHAHADKVIWRMPDQVTSAGPK